MNASKSLLSRTGGTFAAAGLAALFAAPAVATQIERDANAQILLQEGRTVLVYRQDGSFTVTEPGTVELLLVGGGGGGGTLYSGHACGGGGGGGVVTDTVTLQAGTYSVSIGAGGATGVPNKSAAQNGGNTVLAFGGSPLFTAYGGGAGGCAYVDTSARGTGHDGASGGGGQRYNEDGNTAKSGGSAVHGGDGNLGNNGGSSTANQWLAGGGGGAGAPGANGGGSGISNGPGAGGDGVEVQIIGSGDYFWYGGGGAGRRSDNNPSANGGKGGGGASGKPGEDGRGGGGSGGCNGGSGILVVAFARTSEPAVKDGWFECAGGDETQTIRGAKGKEEIRIFRNSGTLTVTRGNGTMEILAVGGGGGGGANYDSAGSGGGGAGGIVHYTNLVVSTGTYAIEVGEGGGVGTNGFATSGLGVVAYGGGAGGHARTDEGGKNGASGGGAGHSTGGSATSPGGKAIFTAYMNKGQAGAATTYIYGAGGGGGAGEVGGTPTSAVPGRGGDGYACDITGASDYYGGGGAGRRLWGGTDRNAAGGQGGGGKLAVGVGYPGEDGKGGGGAGGAKGGSGIFIVRYKMKPTATVIYLR